MKRTCYGCGVKFMGGQMEYLCEACRRLPKFACWVLAFFLFASSSALANDDPPVSFDVKLFHKLSEMLGTQPPTNIIVEIQSAKELNDWYRGFVFRACMSGLQLDPFGIAVTMCHKQRESGAVMIYGRWQRVDSETLHIIIQKTVGVDTKVHEFLHWWLHYRSTPNGILNSELIIRPMVDHILASEEFQRWLDEQTTT
jgi:hypothetical protein